MTRNQRDRAHWAARQREQNDWHLLIQACPLHARQSVDRRRTVRITFTKTRGPLSDPDNRVARAKVILDAIVARRWLIDDAPKFVELEVCEVVGTKTATRIEVWGAA